MNGAATTSQTAKLSLGKDEVITEILPEEREVGGLGSAPPDLQALATVFIKWNASINEGAHSSSALLFCPAALPKCSSDRQP